MDLRTGRMYASVEEARAAGVPESDIAHVVWPAQVTEMVKAIPKVTFPKHPFGRFRNGPAAETAQDRADVPSRRERVSIPNRIPRKRG